MKRYIFFLWVMVLTLFSSCNKEKLIICSKDKKECITVITYKKSDIRYVINGKHYSLPDKNYIKLDISNIDPLGDGVLGCWNKDTYKWLITINGAIVLENRLDTTRFEFRNKLPEDSQGIPTEINFRKDHCFIYDFELGRITPRNGNAVVE